MTVLTIEEYNTRFPKNNEEYFSKLSEDEKKHYLELQALYHELTLLYLIELFSIKEYDDKFKNSPLNYEKIEESNQDIYQYQSNKYLNYIYLRNNIYIERLEKEELDFLEKKLTNSSTTLDKETKEFLNKTLMKVIVEELDKNKIALTNYGPEALDYMKPNNGIIFGFRYNQFDQKENQTNEEWQEIYLKRLNDIYHNLGYFKIKILENNASIPYGIIEYSELSVKTKANLENNEIKIYE